MYIRNSHKHLRSTIKSYRTNWKMLAHKLMVLLHRELIAARIECVRHALSYIVLLTRNPSKNTESVRAHVLMNDDDDCGDSECLLPAISLFVAFLFRVSGVGIRRGFGYYWFIRYRCRCCINLCLDFYFTIRTQIPTIWKWKMNGIGFIFLFDAWNLLTTLHSPFT